MDTRLEEALSNLRLSFHLRIARRLNLPSDEAAIRERMHTMSDRENLKGTSNNTILKIEGYYKSMV